MCYLTSSSHLITQALNMKREKRWAAVSHQWCTVPLWPWWCPHWSGWDHPKSPDVWTARLCLVHAQSLHLAESTRSIRWRNAIHFLEDKMLHVTWWAITIQLMWFLLCCNEILDWIMGLSFTCHQKICQLGQQAGRFTCANTKY